MEQEIKGGVYDRIMYEDEDKSLFGRLITFITDDWRPKDGPIRSYLRTELLKLEYAIEPHQLDHYTNLVTGVNTYITVSKDKRYIGDFSSDEQYNLPYNHGYKYCAVLDSIKDAASVMRVKRAARIKQINDSKAIRSILPPELVDIVQNYTVNTIDVFN
jgi:hypothetical protein